MPRNAAFDSSAASDQGLHSLPTGIYMQCNKCEKVHQKPLKLEVDSSK